MRQRLHRMREAGFPLSFILMVGVTGIVSVIITVIAAIFATIYSNSLMEVATTNSQQTVSQVGHTIDLQAKDMDTTAEMIVAEIQKEDMSTLTDRLCGMVRAQSELEGVMVYNGRGAMIAYGGEGGMLKEQTGVNIGEFQQGTKKYAVSPPHVENLFVGSYPWVITLRMMVEDSPMKEPVYVAIDIDFAKIASYVDNVGIGQHGYCFVVSTNGSGTSLIYHPQQQLIYSGVKKENLQAAAASAKSVYVEKNTIYVSQSTDIDDWQLVGVSFVDELVDARVRESTTILVVAVAAGMVSAVFLALLITVMVSRPIHGLVRSMKDFEKMP